MKKDKREFVRRVYELLDENKKEEQKYHKKLIFIIKNAIFTQIFDKKVENQLFDIFTNYINNTIDYIIRNI